MNEEDDFSVEDLQSSESFEECISNQVRKLINQINNTIKDAHGKNQSQLTIKLPSFKNKTKEKTENMKTLIDGRLIANLMRRGFRVVYKKEDSSITIIWENMKFKRELEFSAKLLQYASTPMDMRNSNTAKEELDIIFND